MADARLVVASAARTTTGTSGANAIPQGANKVSLMANVTAVTGTGPTLDLTVEWSNDGTAWAVGEPTDSFTQITAVSAKAKEFVVKGAAYRVRWTLGGTTPNFTFAVWDFCTP